MCGVFPHLSHTKKAISPPFLFNPALVHQPPPPDRKPDLNNSACAQPQESVKFVREGNSNLVRVLNRPKASYINSESLAKAG
jgi:hypothetical protein